MPTPVGHMIGGFVAARLVDPGARHRLLATLLFVLFFANLADLDFLPGILMGEPRAYHRGLTHSLLGTFGIALVVAAIATRWHARFRQVFVLTLAVYGSHLILDAAMPDMHGATGIPLFWPFSEALIGYAIPLHPALRMVVPLPWVGDPWSFGRALFSPAALAVYAFEVVFFMPLLLVPWLVGRLRKRRTARRASGNLPPDPTAEPRTARKGAAAVTREDGDR